MHLQSEIQIPIWSMLHYRKMRFNRYHLSKAQRIINDKVKLTFNDYPEEVGLWNLQPKDFVENISFNYDRTKVILAQSMTNFLSTKY
jgi:hypothetical protein